MLGGLQFSSPLGSYGVSEWSICLCLHVHTLSQLSPIGGLLFSPVVGAARILSPNSLQLIKGTEREEKLKSA